MIVIITCVISKQVSPTHWSRLTITLSADEPRDTHVSILPRAMVVHLQRVTITREPPCICINAENGHPSPEHAYVKMMEGIYLHIVHRYLLYRFMAFLLGGRSRLHCGISGLSRLVSQARIHHNRMDRDHKGTTWGISWLGSCAEGKCGIGGMWW
jgi:hypothetical protein